VSLLGQSIALAGTYADRFPANCSALKFGELAIDLCEASADSLSLILAGKIASAGLFSEMCRGQVSIRP